MARPVKQGLGYFPLDVDFLEDIKVRKIKRACGHATVEILINLISTIYKDCGYYAVWDDDISFLISEKAGISEDEVAKVVEKALQFDFFDKGIFEKYKILTSKGIQRRYFAAVERRKKVEALTEILLVGINDYINPQAEVVYVDINSINVCRSTQSKVKESKEEKSKEDKSKGEESTVEYLNTLAHLNDELESEQPTPTTQPKPKRKSTLTVEQQERFNQFWELYPKQVSKGAAEKAWKKINPDDDLLLKILGGITNSQRYDSRFREVKWTPYPASWLNSKGWEDKFGVEAAQQQTEGLRGNFMHLLQEEPDDE